MRAREVYRLTGRRTVKRHRDSARGDERRASVGGHAVPGKTTLVEQLPTVAPPAQRAVDRVVASQPASAIEAAPSPEITIRRWQSSGRTR